MKIPVAISGKKSMHVPGFGVPCLKTSQLHRHSEEEVQGIMFRVLNISHKEEKAT